MPEILSVTEMARNFSDVINRVFYQGKSFLLTRNGVPVARLDPAEGTLTGAKLARLWAERPRLEPEDARLWADDLAALKKSITAPEVGAWDT